MICFQNSGNVENHHLNYICKFCTHHDHTIFKNWTSQAVYHRACYLYAIFYVKAASLQRVINDDDCFYYYKSSLVPLIEGLYIYHDSKYYLISQDFSICFVVILHFVAYCAK